MSRRTPSQLSKPPSDTVRIHRANGHISLGREMARRKLVSPEVDERQRTLEKELGRIVTHVRKAGKAERVILFGSLASGRVHATSDLDVVVVQKSRRAFWSRVLELRRELNPQTGLDLLVYTPEEFETLLRDRPFFRDEIIGRGRVVYERA
jgi:predicted nucleotidyltransferase